MKIGLIDVDGHHFPNLALMKIAGYHIDKGDSVEWLNGFEHYDRIYKSKVFTFTPDDTTCYDADEIITGGTGYDIKAKLPDIKQSWYISCDAMVRDAGDVLRDLLNGKEKWDVTIGQEVGKLPRKMKKALHSKRMSKWKHKAASYINRRQVRIHDAEMVVTPDQFDTLKATISGGTIEHGCVVSGKQISEALERYKHRQ